MPPKIPKNPNAPKKKSIYQTVAESKMSYDEQRLALDRELGDGLSQNSKDYIQGKADKAMKMAEKEHEKMEMRRTVAKLASALQSTLGIDPKKRKSGISF